MNKKFKLGAAGLLATCAVVAGSAFGVAAANADPSSASTDTYATVGSDTIQDLGNSWEATNGVDSWNATGSATIVTHNALVGNGAAIDRPNGSGDGRKALSAAWNPNKSSFTDAAGDTSTVTPESIDFSRSSGKPSTTVTAGSTGDNLTSVPIARDAVAVATDGFAADFTEPELQAIYGAPDSTTNENSASGTYTKTAGTTSVGDIEFANGHPELVTAVSPHVAVRVLTPILPQASSGTRQFFQNAIGNSANTTAPWVTDGVEENTASDLTASGEIMPFSAAQYIAQYNGIATDTGVKASTFNLDTINGSAAVTITTNADDSKTAAPGALFGSTATAPNGAVGTFNRDVYAVVPTQVINGTFTAPSTDPTYDADVTTLLTETIPNQSSITTYGFEKIGYSATSSNWIHSSWEN